MRWRDFVPPVLTGRYWRSRRHRREWIRKAPERYLLLKTYISGRYADPKDVPAHLWVELNRAENAQRVVSQRRPRSRGTGR